MPASRRGRKAKAYAEEDARRAAALCWARKRAEIVAARREGAISHEETEAAARA